MQAAGAVEDHHVVAFAAPDIHGALGDRDRALAHDDRQAADIGLPGEDFQLLLRGRTIDVERGQEDALLVAGLQPQRDLAGAGGLARALQADHQDGGGRHHGEIEVLGPSQHLDQRVMDDLHHQLAGGDALDHVLADGALTHGSDEVLDHGQGDVGLEQRHADLAQRLGDVSLGQRAAPLQAVEHIPQP